MTKQQLIERVGIATGRSGPDVERVYEAIIENVTAALAAGENVELRGLGVFEVKETQVRSGRNPRSGGITVIPAKRRVSFQVDKALQRHVAILRSDALASGAGA